MRTRIRSPPVNHPLLASPPAATSPRRSPSPPVTPATPANEFASGGREIAKWLALVLMTLDHANKVLWGGVFEWMADASRIVFPIFAFVLAYNLFARYSADKFNRSFRTMLIAGFVAQPFHAAAFGYWIPGNIMFTLAAGVLVAEACLKGGYFWAAVLFVIAGAVVDYLWFGVAVVASACWFVYRPSMVSMVVGVIAVNTLTLVNGSLWALLALPVLWLVSKLHVHVPRHRWLFVGYYVAHLVILAAVAHG
ncbi:MULTISPECIES: TraX family protein [unclassified Pseudoxanthomonas]|uniref:TraX family protein n=1 Tax=unclassified Pseudoxanthomonas TaxID=2645906 RepID=UPI00307D01CB